VVVGTTTNGNAAVWDSINDTVVSIVVRSTDKPIERYWMVIVMMMDDNKLYD